MSFCQETEQLSWERPYSVVMEWIRACLSFAILQAACWVCMGVVQSGGAWGLLMVPLYQL